MSQPFDAIIIGAGQAGPALAGRLTVAGVTDDIAARCTLSSRRGSAAWFALPSSAGTRA